MTTDPDVFAGRVLQAWNRQEDNANQVLNAVTMRLYELIVEGTRVDTGRARAGWTIAVEEASSFLPPVGNHSEPDSARFISTLEGARLQQKRVIANNVGYVVFLEHGTDRFTGDHMVRLAIQRIAHGALAVAA